MKHQMKPQMKPLHKVLIAIAVLVFGILACENEPTTYEITLLDGTKTYVTASSCYSKSSGGSVMIYCFSKPGLSNPDIMMAGLSFRRK